MESLNRRVSDSMESRKEISELIKSTQDPAAKAMLLVQLQMCDSLVQNTEVVYGVADKLDKHLTSYEAHVIESERILNTGRGMWKVATWFLAIVQAVAVWALITAYTEIKSIKIKQNDLETKVEVHIKSGEQNGKVY